MSSARSPRECPSTSTSYRLVRSPRAYSPKSTARAPGALTNRLMFLSIRPLFAELILQGVKRVELRRVRPATHPGTLVLLYASSPTMKLVGICEIESILESTPEDVW